MEAYKRWVRRHNRRLQLFENLAYTVTWILPGRFSKSKISPEAATSIVEIIAAINDHIIKTDPDITLRVDPIKVSSLSYSLYIKLIKGLEPLVEVAAQIYYGDDKKWNFIATAEAIKVFFRLAMLRNSEYQLLLNGGETVNTRKAFGVGDIHDLRYYYNRNQMNPAGRALSALSRFDENGRMVYEPAWLRRFQPPQQDTLSVSVRLFRMGEMVFIMRPLLYVLLIRKFGTRSWFPWFTSLGLDLIGNGMMHFHIRKRFSEMNNRFFFISFQERDEIKRRKLLFVLYLMREPFFTDYTRVGLDRAKNLLRYIGVSPEIFEFIIRAQTRYTYMSGS